MKGFSRKEPRFSLCGLNCGLCILYRDGHCPGCGGGAGNQGCAMARCAMEQGGVSFCWECAQYPCARYKGFDEYDSFVPHRGRKRDVARAQTMGVDAYLAELKKRMAALEELLAQYNDGRRKTFYGTAVYLLPWEEIQTVMDALHSRPELSDWPIRQRALAAVELFQAAADRQGIQLKLMKKPKRG